MQGGQHRALLFELPMHTNVYITWLAISFKWANTFARQGLDEPDFVPLNVLDLVLGLLALNYGPFYQQANYYYNVQKNLYFKTNLTK